MFQKLIVVVKHLKDYVGKLHFDCFLITWSQNMFSIPNVSGKQINENIIQLQF